MAGSFEHICNDDGSFTMDLIENMGDAHEALEDCHGIIKQLQEAGKPFDPNSFLSRVRQDVEDDVTVDAGHAFALLQFYDRVQATLRWLEQLRRSRIRLIKPSADRLDDHHHVNHDPNATECAWHGDAKGRYHLNLEVDLEHPNAGDVCQVDVTLRYAHRLQSVDAVRLFPGFICTSCSGEFTPGLLQTQIQGYFERHYFRRRLTPARRAKIVDDVRPWWNRFRAGENLCFSCGTNETKS